MSRLVLITILSSFFFLTPLAVLAEDLSKQEPIERLIELNSDGKSHAINPERLEFEAGKLYKLIIKNNAKHKHYFTALRFAAAVWSRKVVAGGVEVKGSIRELELSPGTVAKWFFVPVAAGSYKLICTIKGHKKAGMRGELVIR
jgi:uncharacterized cupredoxin-like copper-binding protein